MLRNAELLLETLHKTLFDKMMNDEMYGNKF